jgi:hypothetical protein
MPNLTQRSVVTASPDHWLNKVDFARFQALMPLPYYHVGSENIWLQVYYPLFQKVESTALQTGVPEMGMNMSRSAIGRMVKSMQFSLLACEPPALLSELPDNRPIALMIEMSQWEAVQKKCGHLIDKATPVFQNSELKIMALVPDSVRAWSEQAAQRIAAEADAANIDAGGGFRSEKRPLWYTSLNFDSISSSEHVFQGKGAGYGNIGDTTWIWKKPMPKGTYDFSIWTKVDEDMGMTQDVKFLENSQADGHQIYFRRETLRSEIKTIVNGWALYELRFEVQQDNSILSIFLHKKNANAPFWYDELLIKNQEFNLYRREPGWVVRNNYWYKLPKN